MKQKLKKEVNISISFLMPRENCRRKLKRKKARKTKTESFIGVHKRITGRILLPVILLVTHNFNPDAKMYYNTGLNGSAGSVHQQPFFTGSFIMSSRESETAH